MDHASTAQRLSALLSLRHPPTALAFVEDAPDGIASPSTPVPSACTFWLVLMWVDAAQAMLCSEAAGRSAWTSAPMAVSGRPGCAALPIALQGNLPGMSLGCAGMRT